MINLKGGFMITIVFFVVIILLLVRCLAYLSQILSKVEEIGFNFYNLAQAIEVFKKDV